MIVIQIPSLTTMMLFRFDESGHPRLSAFFDTSSELSSEIVQDPLENASRVLSWSGMKLPEYKRTCGKNRAGQTTLFANTVI
jgi:hypothetical protein